MAVDVILEDVPSFVKRIGDNVIQGSNNTMIILGTDRASNGISDINSGFGSINSPNKGKESGTIHMVVGRSNEDPDFVNDDGYFYLSMKTNVDNNLGIENIEEQTNDVSAGILKADSIRLFAKKDVKITVNSENYIVLKQDGSIVIEASNIKLGKNATEKLIKGNAFKTLYMSHTHPTAVGVSGPPVQPVIDSIHLSRKNLTE